MDAATPETLSQASRASIMYALAILPITLLHDNYLAGVNFFVFYRNQLLYNGVFDNRDDPPAIQRVSPEAVNHTLTSRERKGGIYSRQLPDNSSYLSIPGYNIDEYEIRFFAAGQGVTRKSFFGAILQFLFALGLQDAEDTIHTAQLSEDNLPAWIFAQETPEWTGPPFQRFHLLNILEAIARHSTQQNQFQELTFQFYINGDVAASGCLTRPLRTRIWCRGLGGVGSGANTTELSSN